MSTRPPGRTRASRKARIPSASGDWVPQFLQPVEAYRLVAPDQEEFADIAYFLREEDRAQVEAIAAEAGAAFSDDDVRRINDIVLRRIAAHWRTIEAAYGEALPAEARTKIKAIVDDYFEQEPFERDAPFVDDALKVLKRNATCARQFLETLDSTVKQDEQRELEAARYVEGLIDKHLDGDWTYFDLLPRMYEFDAACRAARADLDALAKEGGGFKEGEAWSDMIRALLACAKAHGLPTGISKGQARAKGAAQPSPFVALVWQLQQIFPPDYRRHMQSYDALATAMSAARAAGRRRKASAGA